MTIPTSFSYGPTMSFGDIIVFGNGLDEGNFSDLPNQVSLMGFETTGVFLTFTMLYYLQGSYDIPTNTFTLGDGNEKIYWVGFPIDFSTVNLNGGDWKLGI